MKNKHQTPKPILHEATSRLLILHCNDRQKETNEQPLALPVIPIGSTISIFINPVNEVLFVFALHVVDRLVRIVYGRSHIMTVVADMRSALYNSL